MGEKDFHLKEMEKEILTKNEKKLLEVKYRCLKLSAIILIFLLFFYLTLTFLIIEGYVRFNF